MSDNTCAPVRINIGYNNAIKTKYAISITICGEHSLQLVSSAVSSRPMSLRYVLRSRRMRYQLLKALLEVAFSYHKQRLVGRIQPLVPAFRSHVLRCRNVEYVSELLSANLNRFADPIHKVDNAMGRGQMLSLSC